MTDQKKTPPATITEAAQIAYDTVLRRTGDDVDLADIISRGIHDAYRVGQARSHQETAELHARITDAVYARMSESDGRPATTAAAIVADLRAMVGPAVAEKQDRINELEDRLERARRSAHFARVELHALRTRRAIAQDYRRTGVWSAIANVLATKAPDLDVAEEWTDEVTDAVTRALPAEGDRG